LETYQSSPFSFTAKASRMPAIVLAVLLHQKIAHLPAKAFSVTNAGLESSWLLHRRITKFGSNFIKKRDL
jgi:hypothetical protein